MQRYAAYSKENKLIRRVYADNPKAALETARELWVLVCPLWYVVEDSMFEVTRGD